MSWSLTQMGYCSMVGKDIESNQRLKEYKINHYRGVFMLNKLNFAIVCLLVSSVAQAMTVSAGGTVVSGEGKKTAVANTTTIDFNSSTSLPNTGSIQYVGGQVRNGTISVSAAPPGDTSNYLSQGPGNGGNTTIFLGFLADYFGYYAGSPDTYNGLDFFNGNTLVKSYTGTELAGFASLIPNGVRTQGEYWNFFAGPNELFNKVVLKSSSNAFESDNHAFRNVSSVPVPAAAWLFGSALLGLGGLRRKNA